MSHVLRFLLAQVTPQDLLTPSQVRLPREVTLILVAVAVLTLIIAGWAFFFRKREDGLSRWRIRKHRHRSSSSSGQGSDHHHHRRRRRRHGEHLPRNPTLAETGGLPPARSEVPPESDS